MPPNRAPMSTRHEMHAGAIDGIGAENVRVSYHGAADLAEEPIKVNRRAPRLRGADRPRRSADRHR